MLRNNDLAKTVAIYVLLGVLAVSAYINYQYFKNKNSSKIPAEVQSAQVIQGTINNVSGNVVTVNSHASNGSSETKKVNVNNKTTYTKRFMDFSNSQTEKISLSDIKKDLAVTVYLTSDSKDSNLIAESVNIDVDNVLSGKVDSVNSTGMVINYNNKLYSIALTGETNYYSQQDPGSNPNAGTSLPQPEKISNSDISAKDNITVFLTSSFSDSSLSAKTVLKINK